MCVHLILLKWLNTREIDFRTSNLDIVFNSEYFLKLE